MHVYMLCGGYVELDAALMLPNRDPGSLWTVPVSACLVVHAKGRLLFDTGLHRTTITDPVGRLGERRAKFLSIRSQPRTSTTHSPTKPLTASTTSSVTGR